MHKPNLHTLVIITNVRRPNCRNLANFQTFNRISKGQPNFGISTKFQNFDLISTKCQNFVQISEFQPNIKILTEFRNWILNKFWNFNQIYKTAKQQHESFFNWNASWGPAPYLDYPQVDYPQLDYPQLDYPQLDLGTIMRTRFDEFSQDFQTASDPPLPPLPQPCFGKLCCAFLGGNKIFNEIHPDWHDLLPPFSPKINRF